MTEDLEICHLVSGLIASATIGNDLLTAHMQGEESMKSFLKRRLLNSEVPFHEPLKKLNLASFSSSKLSKVKISGKDVTIKADRDLFARLLIVAQKRCMDLSEVFDYSLGPPSLVSLACVDGSLGKTDKYKLLESLTKDIDVPTEDVPPISAIIVDGNIAVCKISS